MGFYVHTTHVDCVIPKDKLQAAYQAVCELNNRNDLKRGGRWPELENPPESGPREDKWFSWMDWNYHETCKDVGEVLGALGFDVYENDAGDLEIGGYDSKTGNEDCFFIVLAPFIVEGSVITWQGEDDSMWRWLFTGGKMVEQYATITWE